MTPETAAALLDSSGRATASDPDARLDIARVALALAVLARPERDGREADAHLEAIAERMRGAVGRSGGSAAEILATVMAGAFGYTGDADTYDDMVNADLAEVIHRRRGLPVALGILYCHAARAAGWGAEGLSFPNHFLIRVQGPGGLHVLDPFRDGAALDAGAMRALLHAMGAGDTLTAAHHQAVSDRDVLLRLQNNILIRALNAGAVEDGLAVLSRMRRLAPDVSRLVLEEAGLLAQLGAVKGAAAILEDFLAAGFGDPSSIRMVEAQLSRLRARLN
jgi:regulator of sirC expression with transglutaminase-like and TPR domain